MMVADRKKWAIIWFTATVLGLGLIACKTFGGEYNSFNDVLKAKARWDIIHGLKSWERKLSEDEIKQLEKFAGETKCNDWTLNYYAQLHLRRNVPEKYMASPEVEKAEDLFIKMRSGKVSSGTYDKYIDEIVSLGNNVIPLLLDLLEYREHHDFFRKDMAIKVLAILKDDRIVPALKREIAREEHRNQLEQELLVILKHNSSDQIVDYVADVIARQKSSFDQQYIISFLSRSELSNQVKMRLYSHYEEFDIDKYGKRAVIRGLREIDSEAAFRQLVGILRKERKSHDGTFRWAASALGKLKNSDPCPVLLDVLKGTPDHVCDELILALSEREYQPAIPVLEEKIRKAGRDAYGVRCQIWAAGALCRLGKDYEKNATIVREYLEKDYDAHDAGYAPYGVAGWLNDRKTVNILVSKISSKEPDKHTIEWTIKALGQIGDESALPALREGLSRLPLPLFSDVGEAIATIGRKNEDQEIVSEGESVQTVARYVRNLGGQQRGWPAGSPESRQRRHEYEQVLNWLNLRPEVIRNMIEQSHSARDRSPWNRELAQLMQIVQLEMRAELSKEEFKPGECIEVRLKFKNLANEPLYFQREGRVRAVFIVRGQEKSFLEAAPRRYKRAGIYRSLILPLNPGETWTMSFEVWPKKGELRPGEYPVKVYYTVIDRYNLPENGRFEGAVVGTLVSNDLTVKIR